jgi:hypothetical protein
MPLQEGLLAVHCEAYPHYELGRFNSLVTLKVEAVFALETSVLTSYKVPKDVYQ